jgi:hypothetical protein
MVSTSLCIYKSISDIYISLTLLKVNNTYINPLPPIIAKGDKYRNNNIPITNIELNNIEKNV